MAFDPTSARPEGSPITRPAFNPATATPAPPEEPGLLRQGADLLLDFAQGGMGVVGAGAAAFGADNVVAKGAGEIAKYAAELQSQQRQAERQGQAERMQAAEATGSMWEEAKAAGQNFLETPGAFTASAVGSAVPTMAAAMLGGLPAAAVTGGGIGAGAVKQSIYERIEQEALKAGQTPEQAAATASAAQAYTGESADQIALGTGLGLAAGGTGLERVFGGGTSAIKNIVGRVAAGTAAEAVPEAVQGGQERLAANLAAQREGFGGDTWTGVVGQGVTEGLASTGPGAVGGLMTPYLDPNAGPISRAAIKAQAQRAAVVPGTLEQAAAAAPTEQDAPPESAGNSNRFDPSSAVPAWFGQYEQTNPIATTGTSPVAPTEQSEPQQQEQLRLVPMKNEEAAARRAEVVAKRTGIEQIVIPHPSVPERFAVVPVDSPLASPATPTAQAEGLDVDTLFQTQAPIPLKNARNLSGMLLMAGGVEHAVVPSPAGDGFGIAPVDQLSPAQRDAWAGFQPGARRGVARRAPGPVATPPVAATPTTSASTTSSTATPIGTPDVGPELAQVTGTTPPAAPAVPEGAQGFNTEAQRAAPALPQIDNNTFTTAVGNAQATIRRERWTPEGGSRFEGRVRAELERAGVQKEAAQAVVDLARQQTPTDAFVTSDALVQAARTLGIVPPTSTAAPDTNLRPLDHGELNIPGRTDGIDAELDRWKADQAKQKRAQAKTDAATRREQKAEAKRLFSQFGPAMIERFAPRFGRKEIQNELDSMVKWQPAKFIDLAQRFEREQAAATPPAAAPAATPDWQMTPDEFIASDIVRRTTINRADLQRQHFEAVRGAVERGEPVPARVLANYSAIVRPDLNDDQRDLMIDQVRGTAPEEIVSGWRSWGRSTPVTPTSTATPEAAPTQAPQMDTPLLQASGRPFKNAKPAFAPGQTAKGRDVLLAQVEQLKQRTAPADLVKDYNALKARIADARRRASLKATKRAEATKLTEWADNQDRELERLRNEIGFVTLKAGTSRFKVLNTPGNLDTFAQRLKKAPIGRWSITVQPDEIYDNVETRTGTVEAQRDAGRSAVAALAARISAWSVRSGRGSAELLGSGLLESFAATGGTSLVGQTVRDSADLAALAQVLRDPRYETLRVIFTLGDKIVGQTAYSSRLPAAVYLPSDLHNHISHDKAGFSADGYFILHNHPSGKAEPSRQDIDLTRGIAKDVPGFRGHVVIDRNQYAVIIASGAARVIDAPQLASVDFHSNPELKHNLLGLEVHGPDALATIGKALQLENGHASVIFTRRQGQVQLIMDLPAALLEDKSKLGVARLMAAVRRMARAAGAGGHRFVVLPQNGDVQALKHLVTRGIFTDVVDADGFGLQALGVHPGRDFLDKHKDARRVVEDSGGAVQVAEDAPDPYSAVETRPNTTEGQLDAGRTAYADVQRRILSLRGQKIGAAVLGSRLAADIATTGGAQLIGQEVRDASDLAMLAQIYRNPNFETWRAFFVKDGKVVGENAFTSRLPGSVLLPEGLAGRLKSEMAKYDADAVYTMHNHPRGSAMPSAEDMSLAAKLRREVPGWQGEVIIDSSEFAVLTGLGLPPLEEFHDMSARDLVEYGVKLTRDPRLASVDFNSAPELEHRLLGLPIGGEADLAKVGKGLQVPDGHAAMVVTAAGKVQALLDVPVAPLLDTKSKLGRAKIMAMVRRIARATGGNARYLVVPKGVKLDAWLVRFGVFQDVVSETGTSMLATVRKRAGNPDLVPLDQIGRNAMRNARQIYEPAGPGYDASEPNARRSRAAEPQQAEAVEGFTPERRTAADWARGAIAANRPWMLGALTRDQIVDIWGKDLPQIVDFDRTVQSMDADRASIAQAADEIVERWRRLPSKEADALADIMHAATLAGFDPDTMNATRPEHDQILADWNALSDAAQAVYREARDTHRATLQAIRNGLADRAERAGSMGRQIADRIRLEFDQFLSDGVYFPLSRFGDLLLIADRNGERTVEAYESGTQREARARQLRADGWRVKMTSKSQYSAIRDGAAGAFTQEVMQHLEALDIDPAQKSQLFDTLNQLAISMLPDASYRRHFKHRKGTPGFSRDAMRGFAQAQQHAAHHIARIRHADQLVATLDDLQAELSETAEGDVTEAQHVANELVRRLEQILNPNTHPVAAAAGQVGFVMSLGGSIASGLVNLSQTPLVFFPWAGSRFGFDKAAAALTKATHDYLGGKWDKWSGFVLSENPNIAPEERDALKRLEESGIINLTLAHDLAGAANADSTVSRRAFALNRAMKVVSWTFHLPETYNRQVSALTAYRLAREAGQTHEDAIETARDGIVRSHFDYSASNRARYMHGNFIRVVTMFKQYSQQMTYMLWRNAWLALRGESAEVKSEARRMLFGVMSMHFAAAGSLGLPLGVFGISPLLSLLAMGSGDEDDPPLDWQDEYRLWLADTFGREGGEAIAKGPLRLLLDVDLASRVGLGDLWVRAPLNEKEGRDAVEQWMLTLLGPIAGYAGQMGTAMQAFEEGQFARGVESMMPKFIAAPLKALRYETEGVRSWRGDDLGVTLSNADIIGTAMGFQPTALSEMYAARSTVKGREAKLQRRREDLMRAWREARDAGDSAGLADAVAGIRKFNEKNRPFAIGAQHLKASWMAHRRAQLQTAQGINLSRRRDELREFGRFANID